MAATTAHDKWLITVRLYTDSNSIRQKDLNNWNQGIRWIKLRAVSGKKDQLFVDLSATSEVKLENVWRMGLTTARRVVMALNVSTLGYFWFHRPRNLRLLNSRSPVSGDLVAWLGRTQHRGEMTSEFDLKAAIAGAVVASRFSRTCRRLPATDDVRLQDACEA